MEPGASTDAACQPKPSSLTVGAITPMKEHAPQPVQPAQPARTTQGLRWSLWQGSKDIPWGTKPTSGVVGLTVLQPKFLKQFPNVPRWAW
jgi:hypothetical protein